MNTEFPALHFALCILHLLPFTLSPLAPSPRHPVNLCLSGKLPSSRTAATSDTRAAILRTEVNHGYRGARIGGRCCGVGRKSGGGSRRGTPGRSLPSSPIFTRQTLFSIPFRVDASDPASRDVAEVQLYVSTNRGASWRLYTHAEPQRGSFSFRAGGDGEYWFAIRTVDRAGQLHPDSVTGPGLRVVVDTIAPQMTLEARAGDGGQILARWQVTEPHLNPESLRHPVPHRAGSALADGGHRPPPRRSPRASRAAKRRGGPRGNSSGSRSAAKWPTWPAIPPSATPRSSPDRARFRARRRRRAPRRLRPGRGPSRRSPLRAMPPAAGGRRPEASSATPRRDDPVAIRIHPVSGGRAAGPDADRGSPFPGVPAGQRPHMVNSMRLELRYEIEPDAPRRKSGGPATAAKPGKAWAPSSSGGACSSSPCPAKASTAFVSPPAQAPDRPGHRPWPARLLPRQARPAELWVGVDLTKPNARILSVRPLAGPQAGQVDIRWEADDSALAPGPVSLAYGPSRDGPWTPIAAGLENTGRYTWWMDGHVPTRTYLRAGSPRRGRQRRRLGNARADRGRSATPAAPHPRRASAVAGAFCLCATASQKPCFRRLSAGYPSAILDTRGTSPARGAYDATNA